MYGKPKCLFLVLCNVIDNSINTILANTELQLRRFLDPGWLNELGGLIT